MAQKKVIVRNLSGETVLGYVLASAFLIRGNVELLRLTGTAMSIPVNDIRWLAYVKDFTSKRPGDPEGLGFTQFAARPRGHGIWTRVTFADGVQLEGLAAGGVGLLDAAAADAGLFLTPPDPRSNVLRLYVPRQAMAEVEFLAVIGTAARPQARKPVGSSQPSLFGED